ncbi:MAG: nucleotidyltransferase family protein [Candidatus Micrarchaeota archaeon]
MKVFILCGGEGTRLRPYTYKNPKPMLMVNGKPILEIIIEHLKKHGFKEFILTVGYLKEKITDYFKDGSKFGVKIEYAVEDAPLGTAGSTIASKKKLKETFVVLMGDAIIDVDLDKMIANHKKSKCIATVGVKRHKTKIEYGVVNIEKGFVKSFAEKPIVENMINTGIYVFEPRVFDFIREKEDFAKNVFPRLLEKGEKINAYELKGIWIDIGQKEDYERLKKEMEK